MFSFIKTVINDANTNIPSSKRFVLVTSSITLNISLLFSVLLLAFGYQVPESLILGLAGIIAGMAGGSYAYTKSKEISARSKGDI